MNIQTILELSLNNGLRGSKKIRSNNFEADIWVDVNYTNIMIRAGNVIRIFNIQYRYNTNEVLSFWEINENSQYIALHKSDMLKILF